MDTAIDLRGLAKVLNGEVSADQVKAPGPGHSPHDRSLSIKLDPSAQDGFIVHSFAHDDPIKCRDYVRERIGLPAWEPRRQINGRASAADIQRNLMQALASERETAPRGRVVKTYDYCDTDGALLYQVCRLEPKDFRQRRPNGNGGWRLEEGQRRIPYRLPELVKYPDATVFITEGEKDADRVAELEYCATTVSSGKWTPDCVRALANRDVLILEDNDEAGRKRALEAAEALQGAAKTIRIVRLPGLADKGDVSDWLDADRRNASKLEGICFDAPLWQPDIEKQPRPKTNATAKTSLQMVRADAVAQKPVEWLWQNRIARGKLTLSAGDPGMGKSQVAADIVARTQRHWAVALSYRPRMPPTTPSARVSSSPAPIYKRCISSRPQ
jgi:AAA domain/Toprim-like